MNCRACGTSNPDGFRFCGGCGAALVALSPPPASLTARGLAARPALEGERKLITALSADVQGSMDVAETTDTEVWHRAMDGLFKVLCAGVHRFDGTVQRFTGDGIMALFGAPIAHEDHASRACYAALHITDAIEEYAVELRREHGLNFHVRIGINSGEVVVGTIGNDLNMEYTAIGHAVGLAHRIQSLASPGKPYITRATAGLVEGQFRLADLGTFAVKGVRDEVRVFAIEGAVGARAAIERARGRGFSTFVGRSTEMARLEDALARASEGDGQVVGVVGEPGVGKSRLCVEFAERCEARGIAVNRTHGVSHGEALPFLPVLNMLRTYFGITDDDTPQQARERIAGRQVLLAPGFEADLPLLFDFFGVAEPTQPTPSVAADARIRRVLAVVQALMRGRSEQQRVGVILLDDLQWFDAASVAFFDQVIEFAPGTRTLVLANFRPEIEWEFDRIQLKPLGAAAIRELIAFTLGRHESLTDFPTYAIKRTAGNPFFIEELIRALIEDGTLEGTPGHYQLTRDLASANVPATVQAVLSARIDRLSEDEKFALQVASVIGRTFSATLLERVAGGADALGGLCAKEFIDQVAFYPEAEYAFRHPLTLEVAYGSQLAERRALVHRAVADAIIALDADRLDEQAAVVAHHVALAGDALDAARWHERAARWSFTRSLDASQSHRRTALELLDGLDDDDAELLRLEVATELARVANRVGDTPAELERLRELVMPTAIKRDDTYAQWGMNVSVGLLRLLGGDVERGLPDVFLSAECAARSTDEGLRKSHEIFNGVGLSYAGEVDQALAHFNLTMKAVEGADPDLGLHGLPRYRIRPFAQAFMTFALALAGRTDLARQTAAEAIRASADELLTPIIARAGASFLAWFVPDAAFTIDFGRAALHSAEEWGATLWANLARVGLGVALAANEAWPEATSALDGALVEMRDHGRFAILEGIALAVLCRAARADADRARALELADEAVVVSQRQNSRLSLPWALVARAELRPENAAPDLDEAERIVRATGQLAHLPLIEAARSQPLVD